MVLLIGLLFIFFSLCVFSMHVLFTALKNWPSDLHASNSFICYSSTNKYSVLLISNMQILDITVFSPLYFSLKKKALCDFRIYFLSPGHTFWLSNLSIVFKEKNTHTDKQQKYFLFFSCFSVQYMQKANPLEFWLKQWFCLHNVSNYSLTIVLFSAGCISIPWVLLCNNSLG